MKKFIVLFFLLIFLPGCTFINKNNTTTNIHDTEDRPVFYYYNVITNPFSGDIFFVLKDNVPDKDKNLFCLTQFGDSEKIFLDECKKVGNYCGNNANNNDSQLCLLVQQKKKEKWKPLANLFFPNSNRYCSDDPYCYKFDGKNGITGAELLKFSGINILDIFFEENTVDSRSQQIRQYNIESDELGGAILYYDRTHNQSHFVIGQHNEVLLFLNDIDASPVLWGKQFKTPGIYFIEGGQTDSPKISKLILPKTYDRNENLLVDFDVRKNYENDGVIEFSVKNYNTKYNFDFKTKVFKTID
mgnify:CR=1 FL=1